MGATADNSNQFDDFEFNDNDLDELISDEEGKAGDDSEFNFDEILGDEETGEQQEEEYEDYIEDENTDGSGQTDSPNFDFEFEDEQLEGNIGTEEDIFVGLGGNEEEEVTGNATEYGTEVDNDELMGGNEEDSYEVIDTSKFIDENGDISVMDNTDATDSFELKYIPIDCINIMHNRIRKSNNVDSLMQSIKSTGMVEPITVAPTKTPDLYVLVAGLRRLIVCAKLGKKVVPCIVNKKLKTLEIPIVEAIYNHTKRYSMREIVAYIKYLEEEKGIASPTMIEYLLMLDNGDYAKLKDVLEDDDDDIAGKMMDDMLSISQAFKALETKRKKQSKEEKELQKVGKVYGDKERSGADQIEGSGEDAFSGVELTDEELKELAVGIKDLDEGLEEENLEDMVAESKQMEGFKPNKQDRDTDNDHIDPAVRKAVIARDGTRCVCCNFGGPGTEALMDVHHVVGVAQGQSDDPDGCVTLCITCHMAVECWAYDKLPITGIDKMPEEEKTRFKKIIRLGNIKREAMAKLGMKREQIREAGKTGTQLRRMPGALQPKA